MTESHGHKRIALFHGLLERARKLQSSQSLGTLSLIYSFDGPDSVRKALSELVESGHITGDFSGRFPDLRIWKTKYRTVNILARPYRLLPKGAERAEEPDYSPPTMTEYPPAPAPEPEHAPDDIEDLFVQLVEAWTSQDAETGEITGSDPALADMPTVPEMEPETPAPAASDPHIVWPGQAVTTEAESARQVRAGHQITFRVSPDVHEWMQDMLDRADEPLSMSSLAKRIFMVEADRIRVDGYRKHRLSAKVLRAARQDHRPFDEFVTALIETGLAALQVDLEVEMAAVEHHHG